MKKFIVYFIITIIVMFIVFGIIDFIRIKNWQMPYFCIKVKSKNYSDSGVEFKYFTGSGKYIGVGYSIEIYKENSQKNIIFRICEYNYKIFGIPVKHESRKIT